MECILQKLIYVYVFQYVICMINVVFNVRVKCNSIICVKKFRYFSNLLQNKLYNFSGKFFFLNFLNIKFIYFE